MKYSYNKNITATIISNLSSEGKVKKALEEGKRIPEHIIEMGAQIRGIPKKHYPIYQAMMTGNMKPFLDIINTVSDEQWFETGDILLMCGKSASSDALAKIQKTLYKNARSSHVAVFFTFHILVDAMPKKGVSPRELNEILAGAKDDWRIIRLNEKPIEKIDDLMKACSFFIAQKYKIFKFNEEEQKKRKSYCSELVRKIFQEARVKGTNFRPEGVIAPAHFDKLADEGDTWIDVTEQVRPAVELVKEYDILFSIFFEQVRNGLMLNRDRFQERLELEKIIRKKLKQKKISKEAAREGLDEISKLNKSMNNQFWDFKKH